MTLNSGDSLDGGAGNDTLVAVVTGSVTPAKLANVETVAFTTTTAATLDMSNATGVTTLTSQGATAAVVMSGIASDTTTMVRDTSLTHTVTFASVTGSADSRSISVANVSSPATAVTGSLTVAGVETLTINSAGTTANVLGIQQTATLASLGPVTGATTTLNVTGAAGLTYGLLGSTITTVDASGLATSDGTGLTATYSSANAAKITGSAGTDSFVVGSSSSADSINAGAGNDTIRYAGTTFLSGTGGDTIDGGDGTDTLQILTGGIAGIAVPTTFTVTNVETITVTDQIGGTYIPAAISATATAFNVTGLTGTTGTPITTAAALTTAASTITGAAGSFSVGLGAAMTISAAPVGALAHALTVAATGTAITDSVTITNNARITSGAQIEVFGTQALTFTGYETVNINNGSVGGIQTTTGAISITGSSGGTSIEKLVVTGGNRFASTGIISADIIDYSGITAAGTAYTNATAAAFMTTGSTATVITGSPSLDVLHAAVSTASSIDGGAGADSIVGGTGNDTLLGSAGADTITAGAGNDSILGGADNDTIIMGGNLASGDVINGGDGTDTLTLTSAAAASGTSNLSNMEIIEISAASLTQDMTAFLNAGFTTISTASTGTIISNAQSNLTNLIFSSTAATTPTFSRLISASTDALTLSFIGGSTALGATSIADEETVTINKSGTATAGAVTMGTVTATSMTSLTITGDNSVAITALSGDSSNAKIDASAATGTINIAATGSSVNMVQTGSATAANSLIGGTGNDSITGGAAADSLTGGAGLDTLVGGAGDDTIVNGLGIDSLVGGDGTDTIQTGNAGVTDGGSAVNTGYIVNLSSSAIPTADVATNTGLIGATTTALLNQNTASVSGSTLTSLGATTTVSDRIDILSGFENITGGTGIDYLVGSSSGNIISGGNTGANYMDGGSGDDSITGGDAIDWILGSAGADTLVGAAAADSLSGGAGADRINGGASAVAADTMTGGAGTDTFVFTSVAEGNGAAVGASTTQLHDVITDFNVTTDGDLILINTSAAMGSFTFTAATTATVTAVAVPAATYANFTAVAAAAATAATEVNSTAAAAQFYLLTIGAVTTATGYSNQTYLVLNTGASIALEVDDLWINVTGVTGTIGSSNISFGAA